MRAVGILRVFLFLLLLFRAFYVFCGVLCCVEAFCHCLWVSTYLLAFCVEKVAVLRVLVFVVWRIILYLTWGFVLCLRLFVTSLWCTYLLMFCVEKSIAYISWRLAVAAGVFCADFVLLDRNRALWTAKSGNSKKCADKQKA